MSEAVTEAVTKAMAAFAENQPRANRGGDEDRSLAKALRDRSRSRDRDPQGREGHRGRENRGTDMARYCPPRETITSSHGQGGHQGGRRRDLAKTSTSAFFRPVTPTPRWAGNATDGGDWDDDDTEVDRDYDGRSGGRDDARGGRDSRSTGHRTGESKSILDGMGRTWAVAKPEEAIENLRKNAAAFYFFDDDLLGRLVGPNCKLDLRRLHLHMGAMVKEAKASVRAIHTKVAGIPASAHTRAILRIEKSPIMQELLGAANTHYVQQLFGPIDVKVPQDFPLEAFRPPQAEWVEWLRAVGTFFELASGAERSRGMMDGIVQALDEDRHSILEASGGHYMVFQRLVDLFSQLWYALMQPDLEQTAYSRERGQDVTRWQDTFQEKAAWEVDTWDWTYLQYLKADPVWVASAIEWANNTYQSSGGHGATAVVKPKGGPVKPDPKGAGGPTVSGPGVALCWRDFALALGLTTMPVSQAGTTPASRKPVLPCTYGAACTRDHRHLLLTHWTKGKATDYVKTNASLYVFKDPKHAGFHQELLDAITKAPASTLP